MQYLLFFLFVFPVLTFSQESAEPLRNTPSEESQKSETAQEKSENNAPQEAPQGDAQISQETSSLQNKDYPTLIAEAWNKERKKLPELYWQWGEQLYQQQQKEKALLAWMSYLDVSLSDWQTFSKVSQHFAAKGYPEHAVRVLETALSTTLEAEQCFAGADLARAWENDLLEEKFLQEIIQRHWHDEQKILPQAMQKLIAVYEKQQQKQNSTEKQQQELQHKITQLKMGIRPTDVKIVMTWDTATDIDLWVTNPQMKRCFYTNTITTTGEKLHNDDTDGFGPETFTILKAQPGRYKVQANYYGGFKGKTKVDFVITFNVGSTNQKQKKYTVYLEKQGDTQDVIDLYIPNDLQ